MDKFEDEERLKQILECVKKEIDDDLLERIMNTQDKFNYRDVNGDQNIDSGANGEWCNGGRICGAKNVATMTDHDPPEIAASTGNKMQGNGSEAEKRAAKRRLLEEKKDLKMANKIYKPSECMKHMTVEVHPALSGWWFAADVAREVAAAGARMRSAPALCSPALVLWGRAAPPALAADDGMVQLAPSHQGCDRALYVTSAEELAELVATRSLSQKMDHISQMTNCQMTLLVFGAEDYFKPSGRKRANNQRHQMTEIELEMATTDALVTAGCDTVRVETPNELALTIVHFTKAIAEAPYKLSRRQREERTRFYMPGDNKQCVPVSRDGAGLGRLWQQMLAVLPASSLERSRALCARYASPRQLYEEVQTEEGVQRVADTGVARSAAPGARARRCGGEFARRLAALLTASRGDELLL